MSIVNGRAQAVVWNISNHNTDRIRDSLCLVEKFQISQSVEKFATEELEAAAIKILEKYFSGCKVPKECLIGIGISVREGSMRKCLQQKQALYQERGF